MDDTITPACSTEHLDLDEVVVGPPRTAQQRAQLEALTRARLARASDEPPTRARALRAAVVSSHLWLASSLARRFRGRSEDEEDLVQVARRGLVEAVVRHDPHVGPYGAFARSTITGLLKRHLRDHGWAVRPPRPTQELAVAIWRLRPVLTQSVGSDPDDATLAAGLHTSVAQVREARLAMAGFQSATLDSPAFEQSWPHPLQTASESDEADNRVLVQAAVRRLGVEEQRLLAWRFYEQCTQAEIAVRLGTSQMQVSRLLARLLTRLRVMIGPLDPDGAAAPAA